MDESLLWAWVFKIVYYPGRYCTEDERSRKATFGRKNVLKLRFLSPGMELIHNVNLSQAFIRINKLDIHIVFSMGLQMCGIWEQYNKEPRKKGSLKYFSFKWDTQWRKQGKKFEREKWEMRAIWKPQMQANHYGYHGETLSVSCP